MGSRDGVCGAGNQETVILSGVGGSRSEAATESKDSLQEYSEIDLAGSSHDAPHAVRTPKCVRDGIERYGVLRVLSLRFAKGNSAQDDRSFG